LCEELIKILVQLSKKYNKQVILTTHNPFVLDGLDLNDPEQKLFVVRRNGDGETVADSIPAIKNIKLSQAWLQGFIGGNPETIN
jgi:AAA15 family ATPase/GTPase